MKFYMRKRGKVLVAEDSWAIDGLARYRDGDEVRVEVTKARSVKQNKAWHGALDRAWTNLPERFDNMFPSQAAFEDSIKIAAGHCRMTLNVETGEFIAVPLSTAFDMMDAAEFNAFLERALDALHKHVFPDTDPEEMRRWLLQTRERAA